MMTMPKTEKKDNSESLTHNYSDDELISGELYLKCQTLEKEQVKMLRIRQNLLILNEKNESISKRLLKIKTEFDFYKAHLHNTLFNIRMCTEKQKILSRKKLDDFQKKAQSYQEYHQKVSPKKYELEELIINNRHLQEEWESQSDLLKLTKGQHAELVNFVVKTFQNKVCEFCDIVLRLNLR